MAAKKPAAPAPKPALKPKAAAVAVAAAILGAGTVLEELAGVVKVAPKKDEALKDYTTRVCEKIGVMSDEDFNKLSKPAQDYFNAVATAIQGEKEIPEPPAVKGGKTAPAPKAAVAPKGAAATKPAAKPAAAPAKPKGDSVAQKVRVEVIKKPDIEFEALTKKLGGEHKVGGHAWNIYNEAVRVMETAKEMGKLAA